MSAEFRLSPAAEHDLDEIFEYVLVESGSARAAYVYNTFMDTIMMLAESPGMGADKPELSPRPLRSWPLWSWIILYDPASTPLEVMRVIHGSRDQRADEFP